MLKFMNVSWLMVLIIFLTGCGMQSIPTAKNDVEAKWAEVQNQYKRRMDLIPNLVNTVKGYAAHEEKTLVEVMEARASASKITIDPSKLDPAEMQKYIQSQGAISAALGKLMVVSENYPNLKADANFRDLQAQLEGTENRITVARNRYIESIQQFNNLVTVPPTSWYNSIFLKLEKFPQFQNENAEQAAQAPEVKF